MNLQSLVTEAQQVKRGTGRWLGARRRCHASAPEPLDVLLWINANSGEILSHDLVPPDAPPTRLWESFRRAVCDPDTGRPVRPRRVQVACPQLGSMLKGLAPLLDFEAELRPLPPPAEEMLDALLEHLGSPDRSYLDVQGVTPELVAEVAAVAVHFADLAPWEHMSDASLFALGGLTDEPLYCSILGLAGECFGLAVFRTAEAAQKGLAGELGETFPGLSITFEELEDIGPRMATDVDRHGWPVTEHGEFVLVMNCDRPDPLPSAEELELARAVLHAVGSSAEHILAEGLQTLSAQGNLEGKRIDILWPVAFNAPKRRRRKK